MRIARTVQARALAASAVIVFIGLVGLGTVGGSAVAAASVSGSDGDVVLGADSQSTPFATGISTSGILAFHAVSTAQSGYGILA